MGQKKEKDPHYKGELTPKHLKDGPLDDRKCTDMMCLLFFVAFWVGMIMIGVTAMSTGTPLRLTYAYDQKGAACGVEGAADYKFLLFIRDATSDIKPYSLNSTACVTSCPNGEGGDPVCYNDIDCAGQGQYQTVETFKRFCLPIGENDKDALLNGGLSLGFFSRAISDLRETWPIILAVGGIALVFGFVYIVLMKYFSGVLIWGLMAVFVLGTGGFGYVCYSTDPDSGSTLASLGEGGLKAVAYTCFAIAALSTVLVCCLREKISLSIAILKAAAHFLEDEPGILILPPIFMVFTLLFYVGWVTVATYIIGTNDITSAGSGMPYAQFDWTTPGAAMFGYYFFALLWNHALGVALSQFIIASTVCLWYFKQGTKRFGVSPIKASLRRSINHMGSLAFGSFLIGFLQFVKHVLDYVQKKVTAVPVGANPKTNFVISCCNCVVGCFERSLKFLTTHAYIQIAMTGESFCKATTEAFLLALRNVVRFGMVHGFAWLFLFLGQIIVSGCATFLGYLIITQTEHYKESVISPVVPTIFFFLSSYIVAHVFMGIYGMSADTIVHCFAMDEEIHDGQVMHAPEELRDYIDNKLTKKFLIED